MNKHYLIPNDLLIPGKIYGTRPGDRCPKYLYMGPCFEHKTQIKPLQEHDGIQPGTIFDYIDTACLLKWNSLYNKILSHSDTLNLIIHDLIDLTGDLHYRYNWRHHLDNMRKIRFNHEIKTLFDPAAITPETIESPWEDCFIEYSPRIQCYAFATNGIPAQCRTVYTLKPCN